ncbi:galactomannan galactosyltransferase 1 [Phtheirospermum japonicum]|uniref:Galactomannan galactosyltransferase 1 n=1 Tax=Phtheirospermum japonicum TaxID=374723 RepID=A0A830C038_9LAMI|nr:galactomannan galactosyltransferase 1 [Phtheirospermum japonicum]
MAKPILHIKSSNISRERILCIAASIGAILIFFVLCTYTKEPSFSPLLPRPNIKEPAAEKTFYDDPKTRYTMDKPMTNWDEKRRKWLENNPSFASKNNGVMVITGSQPWSCKNPTGDHLLLRFFKNKVDYCRIHGYEIFYNNAFLDPKMKSVWAKIPILRAAMLAHPEIEWIFWMDADAIFTDMEFKIPLERYKDHNLVVHGWPKMIYEEKSWVSVNTGAVLIRNCQWAMDFLDVWAGMGPRSPDYAEWGRILRSTLSDKTFPDSDEQSSLVYLLLKGDKKWKDKIYVENEYSLHGYWLGIVGKLDEIARKYVDMERRDKRLRRRHAEAVSAEKERHVGEGWRRPFVTHFTGCQPCSGDHNPAYEGDSCLVGMERALNFADNQVLRNYGFVRPDVGNASFVSPLPFDYGLI